MNIMNDTKSLEVQKQIDEEVAKLAEGTTNKSQLGTSAKSVCSLNNNIKDKDKISKSLKRLKKEKKARKRSKKEKKFRKYIVNKIRNEAENNSKSSNRLLDGSDEENPSEYNHRLAFLITELKVSQMDQIY